MSSNGDKSRTFHRQELPYNKKEQNKDEKFLVLLCYIQLIQVCFRVCSLFVHFYVPPYVTTVCLCWILGSLELDCFVDVSGILSLFVMKTMLPLPRGL
jgi:hypothetical protein